MTHVVQQGRSKSIANHNTDVQSKAASHQHIGDYNPMSEDLVNNNSVIGAMQNTSKVKALSNETPQNQSVEYEQGKRFFGIS